MSPRFFFPRPKQTLCTYWFAFIVFCFCFFLFPGQSNSAQVNLAWDPGDQSVAAGNPVVAGYKVHYGIASRNYPSTIEVGNTTSTTVPNLQDGVTYYFAVTAYDSSGRESPYSNEVSYQPIQKGAVEGNGPSRNYIYWHHLVQGLVYVWFMDGPTFVSDQYVRTVVGGTNWRIEGAGDLNGDGRLDLLWRHQTSGDVYVWFMDGATYIRDQFIRNVADVNWRIEGIGDFNGDGKQDLLWRNQASGDLYVWLMDGATYLGDRFVRNVSDTNWQVEGVGDFNGDGKPDLLWHHKTRGQVYVWFMDGPTFVSERYIRTVEDTNWKIEKVADFNGDGKPDILWRHRGTGSVYVWFMDGPTYVNGQPIRTVEDPNWDIGG